MMTSDFSNQKIYLSALGIACPLGLGKQAVIQALFVENKDHFAVRETLLSGKSVPIGRVPFDLPDLPQEFNSLNSRNNRLLRLALDEVAENVEELKEKYGSSRVGVILATSTSGMLEGEMGFAHKKLTGNWPEEYSYTQQEPSSPSVFAAQYLTVSGPAYTISTACSSASKAICSAKRLINAGVCDAVITGGVDTLCKMTLNGFDSLELISEKVCNPFSKNRDGISIGEGAAVFVVTREQFDSESSIELLGCGESSDAYHICSPDPSGRGAEIAIREALHMASLTVDEIAYINLHGTGTILNDAMESSCINRIFGNSVPCSSTKALTGHTLGASGAIEAGFLWLVLDQEQDGRIPLPPHIWDGEWDPQLPTIKLAQNGEHTSAINETFALMSNTFAFGGSNVSLILGRKMKMNDD